MSRQVSTETNPTAHNSPVRSAAIGSIERAHRFPYTSETGRGLRQGAAGPAL